MKFFKSLNIFLLSFFFSLICIAVFFSLANYTNFLDHFLAIIYFLIKFSTVTYTEINYFVNSDFIVSFLAYVQQEFNNLIEKFYLLEELFDFSATGALSNFLFNLLFIISSSHVVNVLLILLPVLLSVAFMTIIERKQLAAMQRRVGPNTVGYYGVLQPFADALKLILKENVIPAQSNKLIFYLAPVASLFFSLLGWGIVPFGPGLAISDFSMGILYTLALSSLGVYGVLFAG
jgi:hypothetical protein